MVVEIFSYHLFKIYLKYLKQQYWIGRLSSRWYRTSRRQNSKI